MITWDVAVIGAGVAGSTAAALLADVGLRVILLEKGTLPRHKVCGEFLSPEGAACLERLGVWPWVQAISPQRVRAFALSARGREMQCPLPDAGWGVSRWTLDHLLWKYAQAKGVVVWDGSAVAHVEGDFAQRFALELRRPNRPPQRVQARAVLCAAGRQWRPRGIESTSHRDLQSGLVGLKAHFQGVHLDERVELHAVSQGYCGLVEVEGHRANLCCLTHAEALRQAGGTPERYFATALRQNAYLHGRLAEAKRLEAPWMAVSFTYRQPPAPVDHGIWQVGDSAGMIAPLTGDGMGMGLRAAELAATTLLQAFRGDLTWQQATAEYADRWWQEFIPRLRWGRRLEAMLLNPRLATLGCVVLKLTPWLIPLIYRRTRGSAPSRVC